MLVLHLLILGVIQGLTEFLPVSSSGHLILIPHFLGWADQGIEIDVAMHVGTLIAVCLYFWHEIRDLFQAVWKYVWGGFDQNDWNDQVTLAFSLVIATIPAVIVGFMLKKINMEALRNPINIAYMTGIFAIFLYLADFFGEQKKGLSHINLKKGFLIGLGQAMALIPGVSRSGICMTVGLSLGLTRVAAARYAFLLSIPAILGAATLTTLDYLAEPSGLVSISDVLLAVSFSGIAGLGAIHFMLTFLARYSLKIFVIYRLILVIAILRVFG